MSVWLKYLAVVALVGNGLAAAWNAIALGRTVLQGAFDESAGLPALNLVLAIIAIVLAAMVAAPARQSIDAGAKIMAVPNVLIGALGVASGAMALVVLVRQPLNGLSADTLAANALGVQSVAQNTFFSACTLALALLVLASRKRSV